MQILAHLMKAETLSWSEWLSSLCEGPLDDAKIGKFCEFNSRKKFFFAPRLQKGGCGLTFALPLRRRTARRLFVIADSRHMTFS